MKKTYLIIFLSLVLLISCKQEKYQLIWSDEFEQEGYPDSTKWTHRIGGHGWGNKELQYYTANLKNSEVRDGILFITALEDSVEESGYTSARLTTKSTKGHWRYGKVEARIKLPYGKSLWPAFWMLGVNNSEVGWPACGEIDIMEMIGGAGHDQTVYGTLHWKNREGKQAHKGSPYSLESGIFHDDFHVFGIEWDPQEINWYVDGQKSYSIQISTDEFSAFQNEFFILLNLAVGGSWPGYPDTTSVFPQTMEVDYVRVYQKKSY